MTGDVDRNLPKWLLAAGFLAFGTAVLVARAHPATGYELSIYRATPVAFWAGVGGALCLSLGVLVVADVQGWTRDAAYLLAYVAILSVLALPVIRGYHFFGAGDSLSHLGYARSMLGGDLSAVGFLYPGVHTAAIAVASVTGLALTAAFELVVVVYFLSYLAFVPLCVRAVTDDRLAVAVGTFAALLVLPINNVSVHPVAHPTTQAILFTPVLVFLLFRYVTHASTADRPRFLPTPYGVLLVVAGGALVVVHPQQALNVVILLATVLGVQVVTRRYRPDHRVAAHGLLAGPTVALAAVWIGWSVRHERVAGSIRGVVTGLLGGAPPADQVAQRSGSLAALGGSIPELFVKLFLVNAVFAALTGVVVLLEATGRLDGRSDGAALRRYLVFALVPVGGLFGVFFVASVTTQYFRYLGFLMVFGTILGAVALTAGGTWLERYTSRGVARSALALVLVACLALQVPATFSSPYVYQDNAQVTEMTMTGYETTFDNRDPGVAFVGIRGGPDRFVEEHYGPTSGTATGFPGKEATVPEAVFDTNLSTYYASERYLPSTRADYLREVVLYEGFRYPAAGFRSLRTARGIDRVRTNGEYRLYVVGGTNATSA